MTHPRSPTGAGQQPRVQISPGGKSAELIRLPAPAGNDSISNSPKDATAIELRPYQQTDISRLAASYAAGHRAPLYVLPTAGGKTVVFCVVILGANRKRRRTLVVVHRRELIRQAAAKLHWTGVRFGVIAAGFEPHPDAMVQLGSVQTLASRMGSLPTFDFIVFDEAHHARAESWRDLIHAQPQAKLLGVTATPARLDGKGLGIEAGGCFDDLVIGASAAELIAEGYLSPVRCFVPARRLDLAGVRVRGGDYVAADLAPMVDGAAITGDAVEQYRARADHAPAIAFCITVAHAEHVAEAFRTAGYRAACVHGTTPILERDRLIAGLGDGSIEVLTSCDLISEGLDVPAVGCVILLRPTKSIVLHRQQIGRGMRPAPGKTLIVNDHVANCLVHGLPETEPRWSLAGIDKPKADTVAPIWTCKACGQANPIGKLHCDCGEPRPAACRPLPQYAPGQLAELTAARLAEVRRMSYREVVAGDLSEAELREFARARGYHPRWVRHRLREQRAAES